MELIALILGGLALLFGILAFFILNKKISMPQDRSGELQAFENKLRDEVQRLRSDLSSQESDTRRELMDSLARQNENNSKENRENREEISNSLSRLSERINSDAVKNREELAKSLASMSDTIAKLTENLNEETRKNREESNSSLTKLSQQINADAGKNREELTNALNNLSESQARKIQDLATNLQSNFEELRKTMEGRLEKIQETNEKKLEEMRKTVDEKLHDTLEKRLSASFKQVSERLEQVHKGLGEMQTLASGVGDLKKVLSNVSTRGMMGEIQLEAILEQMLNPDQYERNFRPYPKRDQVVEFAIRLPGRDDDGSFVYLPVDSKFPLASYNNLVDAQEEANTAKIENARKELRSSIISSARDIHNKYINAPITTDFALLFLPLEGLYAEVLRDSSIFEEILRKYKVTVVGPTTISALLNSLQMGFRTLAIQKRSSEVWKTLGAIKTDFGTFGDLLLKTQKKLEEASKTINKASHRTRIITKKLDKVQELPVDQTAEILELEALEEDDY